MSSSSSSDNPVNNNTNTFYDHFYDGKGALPIIYSDNYNISFFGLEKLHPFDRYAQHKFVVDLNHFT